MPHFTLQLTNEGPLITAVLGVTQARADALKASGKPVPSMQKMRALIDTGASCTCVDPTILQALQLSPTGTAPVFTPSTGNKSVDLDQYDVSLAIYASTQHLPFYLPVIAVVASPLKAAQGIDALIGRDVLQHCLLSYNGQSGFFTLAY